MTGIQFKKAVEWYIYVMTAYVRKMYKELAFFKECVFPAAFNDRHLD